MKKILKKDLIYILFIMYALICLFFNIQLDFINALIVLGLIIFSLVKNRNNALFFFFFLVIGYFIFSVLICRYIFIGGPLNGEFHQLKFTNTASIGLNCLLLFCSIIIYFIRNSKKIKINSDFFRYRNTNNKTLIVSLGIISIIIFALLNNMFFHFFSNSEQIYEYCIILFIFGFYYIGNNKKLRIILSILLLIFVGYTLIQGGRVSILQMIIVFFLMNMIHKYDYKKIAILTFMGIILFTIFGIYGDYISWGTEFSISYIIEQLIERKFALDTSVSSYFTGLTFVEYSNFVSFGDRISNFIGYIKYTFLGKYANYKQLQAITINNYIHYYGGYITSYFYYWLGPIGIVLISLYIGKFLNVINNLTIRSSHFKKLLIVYFISTVPRWFLYFPTALFRGLIIFVIIYFIINIYISGEKYEKS